MSKLTVVLLTSDSPWQRALAGRLAGEEAISLEGIVIQSIPETRRVEWIRKALIRRPKVLANKIVTRLLLGRVLEEIASTELDWFGHEGRPRDWPARPLLEVEDINGPEVVDFLRGLRPDVGAVSGTRIIREPIFAVEPPDLLLNLHTGVSPYYKGGPNCTLWALSRGEPEMIGATIHVLDPGIDSGDILLTEYTPVEATDTVATAVARTVAHGHDMYVRVLRAISQGHPATGVGQAGLGEGRTYYNREWGPRDLWRAVRYVGSGGVAAWIAAGRPRNPRVRLVDFPAPSQPRTTS